MFAKKKINSTRPFHYFSSIDRFSILCFDTIESDFPRFLKTLFTFRAFLFVGAE